MIFKALQQQQKSARKRVTVTISQELYDYVALTAQQNGSTVSAAAAALLRHGCNCAAKADKEAQGQPRQ